MSQSNRKKSDWYIPPDIAVWLGMFFIPPLVAMLFFVPLFRARNGDPAMLYVAAAFAAVGIVLLFFARLPLYRQRRFFTFGPAALDERHRRLYRWAYRFLGVSAIQLVLLLTLR